MGSLSQSLLQNSLLSFLPNNLHLNEKFTLKEDETWLENVRMSC